MKSLWALRKFDCINYYYHIYYCESSSFHKKRLGDLFCITFTLSKEVDCCKAVDFFRFMWYNYENRQGGQYDEQLNNGTI